MQAKDIKNIPDLIEFFEVIPENEWCIKTLEDENNKCCAMGHLNRKLTGSPWSSEAYDLLDGLSIEWHDLIRANNDDEINPKRGTLTYLRSLVNQ